jgi:hypothetical protein
MLELQLDLKNHGDVVIDTDYQKELDIRDDAYKQLLKRLEGVRSAQSMQVGPLIPVGIQL